MTTVIAAFARTPIGSLNGTLRQLTATQLGAAAIKGALGKVPAVTAAEIGEVFIGNVLSAGIGQAPATQAAIYAGLGHDVPSTTVNKVCASGMKSVAFASAAVSAGIAEVAVAGGMESMTNAPHLLHARAGTRLGDATLVDSLVRDGLWDPYDNRHMGACAEVLSKEMGIGRDEQDDYAELSYERARKSKAFHSDFELVQVEVPKDRKSTVSAVFREDEEPKTQDLSKLRQLRPAFQKENGTVTAGNASTINDGAAALIVTSLKFAEERGLTPLCEIVAYADAQRDPTHFTIAPALAIPKLLRRANVHLNDVDLFEINEAFSIVAIANAKLLGIPIANVNVHGGAVALGHPIGASGARIVGSLASALHNNQGKLGVAAICNGGGGASAMLLKAL
mmetsp:Transcript_22161/g.71445  ORF Transcript_22161/g.71445 Transcript_22161/m.71445 type:complete len:394 (-) Transcript_22161:144-1325(-)